MKDKINFVRATVIGGIFFLIPVAIMVFVVGKLVGMLKAIAGSVAPFLPVESVVGMVFLNIAAISVLLALCFVAGLAAQNTMGKKVGFSLESLLLTTLPGFSFVKEFADNMRKSDELAESFIPILLQLDATPRLRSKSSAKRRGKWWSISPVRPTPGRARWPMLHPTASGACQ